MIPQKVAWDPFAGPLLPEQILPPDRHAAGVAAYLSVRFLARYFTSRTLTPFAIYCLVVGLLALVRFA